MIDTVIFDLDGTLIDSERVILKRYQRVFAEYGCENTPTLAEYVDNCLGRTTPGNLQFCIDSRGIDADIEITYKKWKEYELEDNAKGYDLKEDAKDVLQYLKENDYKIVLATSSNKQRAHQVLEKAEIIQYFDGLVCQEDITKSKPDPQIYLMAANKVNSINENCVVVEDSAAGILGAKAANMNALCIIDMKEPVAEIINKADKVIYSLREVIDYLNS